MTVSGTISTTAIDAVSIIEKAYRRLRVFGPQVTGEMLTEARRTLFLRLSALTNKGLQLWAIDSITEALVLAQAAYTLDDGTVDVLQVNFTLSGVETPMARIGKDSYVTLANKADAGQPSMYWLDRQRDAPVLRLYPVPDAAADAGSLTIWRKRHVMDVGEFTNTLDIPQRWHEAVIWDLADNLGSETPDVDPMLMARAEKKAASELIMAMNAETDAAPLVILPNLKSYTG